MSEEGSGGGRGKHGIRFWVGGVASLLLLYFLSVGPMAKIVGYSPMPKMIAVTQLRPPPSAVDKGVRVFYKPLRYLYEASDQVKGYCDWYIGLWGIH